MYDHSAHSHDCGKIGLQTGLLCAVLGFVLALLLIGWFTSASAGVEWLPIVRFLLIPLVALLITAGIFGFKAGRYLCERGNQMSWNVLIGISLAFGSIAAASLAGSFAVLLTDLPHLINVGLLILFVLPLLFVLIYGSIPAIGLGLLYAVLVKKQLANMDH